MQTQTETQTSPTTTVAPDDNPNIREPERIDAEITAARKAVISADQTVEKRSAESSAPRS